MNEYERVIKERLKTYTIHDFVFPLHFYRKAKGKRDVHELEIAKLLEQENILRIEPGHSGKTVVYIKHSPNYVTKAVLLFTDKIIVVTAYRYPARLL